MGKFQMVISRRSGWAALVAAMICVPILALAEAPVSQSGGYAIGGFDVVAYFVKKSAVMGKPEFSHAWHGATWLFESAENRDKFATKPETYAPQYGGYCAVSMSGGKQSKADPQAWSVRDGKLYLNGNQSVNGKFNADGDTYVSRANSWWSRSYDR